MASRAERIEEAARALLEAVGECDHFDHHGYCQTHFVSKPCEVAALRAALALPADAAGSAEAVRAACAAVPALEEARRRRLRWADEAHAQILAVPVPAQPAPEGAGEKCPRCACERNTRGAVSGANGRFAGACSDEFHGEAPDPDATPRAEAYVEWCARHANIEKVPGPFCPACAYASVMRDGVKMGRESAPRAAAAPGHTDLMVTPESVGPYVAAEAVREACAKACDDLGARANEKVREWSMSDHGREAAAMVERYHASAYREAAAAIRSLPLPAAPASAEAVARDAATEAMRLLLDQTTSVLLGRKDVVSNEAIIRRAVAHALRGGG